MLWNSWSGCQSKVVAFFNCLVNSAETDMIRSMCGSIWSDISMRLYAMARLFQVKSRYVSSCEIG